MHMHLHRPLVAAALLTLLAGCGATPQESGTPNPTDPDARAFTGTIISLRPMTSTMIISKDERVGSDVFPNEIIVKYDAQTQFEMDSHPATLDRIGQYMTVHVTGHMRDGQMFAEVADFSSILPHNVRPAPSTAPTASK
jgi:hypothetical protein